jgi:O-antigen ligase
MNREAWDKWLERGILILVLAIMVFGPLATGAVRALEFLVIQALTIGVMLLWVARLWVGPKPKVLWPPMCWVVVAFVVYAIARYVTADIEYVARKELIRILVYAFLFLAILNNLHRLESTQIISFTMIFLAMGISCYAVYQFVTGSDRVWHFITPYKGRGAGTYICPNHLAGLLEMLLPLTLAYTLVGRSRVLTKILLAYAAVVMAAGIGATVSRAGWVCGGVALVVLFGILAMHRGYRLPALVLLMGLMGSGIFFMLKAEPLKKRFFQPTMPGLTDADMRYELWGAAIQLWKGNPWFGTGPAHYNARFRAQRPVRIQAQPDRAHNDYLNVLADWGAVGAAIVAAGIGGLFLTVFKTWKYVRQPENKLGRGLSNKLAFVLGAAAGLLALLLHSAFDFNMHIPANAILAFALAALLVSHLRFATDRFWSSARPRIKLPLTALLLVGVLYLGWQEVRLGREYVLLERASRKPVYSPDQAALLERAFIIEPANFETSYAIGESFRMRSFEGGDNHREMARRAMEWYDRGTKLNPFDGYNYMRYGMCLDWLNRTEEAMTYFDRADRLDPNGYYTAAHIGWHYIQIRDYAAARSWFQRSKMLRLNNNEIADSYLEIAQAKMLQKATNEVGTLAR